MTRIHPTLPSRKSPNEAWGGGGAPRCRSPQESEKRLAPKTAAPFSAASTGTEFWKRGKDPHPHTFGLSKKQPVFTKGRFRPDEGLKLRNLGTTPISGKTLSERKGHSQSSGRVPGYFRSSSRNSKFHSRNTKFHSWNGISRLEQYENQNSRSNSRSDSRN